jgi:hypothetical protein
VIISLVKKYKLKINVCICIFHHSSYVLCFCMQISVCSIFDSEMDLVYVDNDVICTVHQSVMYVALSYIVHITLNCISNAYLWSTLRFF